MQFRDIVGNNELKKKLIETVNNNRIHHAQLFLGKQGTGKVALAIAYAQYINCENPHDGDSCGECKSCKKYAGLIHPDLHFIFPVIKTPKITKPISADFLNNWREFILNNHYISFEDWLLFLEAENQQAGIFAHESQEIIRIVNLKTFEAKYKTLIIYLPEKMNITAANKLLKALEEPPANTIFILACEDESQLLTTIRSRTQLVKFDNPKTDEIKKYLSEKFSSIESNQLADIAKISNGDINTAIKLVSQLNLGSQNSFTENFNYFSKFMRISYAFNIKEIIEFIDTLNSIGRERQKQFVEYSIRLLRENFSLGYDPKISYLTKNEFDFSNNFHKFIHQNNIKQLYTEFNKAHYDITRNCASKILFMDLFLKTSQLLKIKRT